MSSPFTNQRFCKLMQKETCISEMICSILATDNSFFFFFNQMLGFHSPFSQSYTNQNSLAWSTTPLNKVKIFGLRIIWVLGHQNWDSNQHKR
jgi:hypothetical protein